ncbi:MAG: F0F1 ATP synthase subunit delta [Burkholderiales bacterium]|jgi:F-type H+-transporting ATPase subunit delta|nr:F0F1 ATP synthase subunit delta [Burkholderiales bacterium]
MAERLTVARPYAEAVFALAREQKRLPEWLAYLSLLRVVAEDAKMKLFLGDPNIAADEKIAAIITVCGNRLSDDGKRLVDVLTRAKRIALLPEIEILFKASKDAAEDTVQAAIETALPIDEAQVTVLKNVLRARTGKKVEAQVSINPELIGGVRIKVGDQIIDASVQGRLAQMAQALRA